VRLVLATGQLHDKTLREGTLEELLLVAKAVSGLRLPALRHTAKALALAAAPGATLREAAKVAQGDDVHVDSFEASFVDKLQSGWIRLEELASVSPLLDWEKPELPKLVLGRVRSLLEGSCSAMCQTAGWDTEDELVHGRSLLRRLFLGKPLGARLEVCNRLLPLGACEKVALRVDRRDFMASALQGLHALDRRQLRGQVVVEFEGEVAEDHGGPRRNFFASFGSRLIPDLPNLWRRLGQGVVAPVADIIAERSPKAGCKGLDCVEDVYRACGRAYGLAAKHADATGEELAGFFVHQVARDEQVTLEELQQELADAEGADFRASGAVLENRLEDMGLGNVKLSRVISGTVEEVELVPGGRDINVTEENKAQWLQLHLENKLYGSLKKSADSFREGIIDVLGGCRRTCPWFALVAPSELARLWAGSAVDEDDVSQWREVALVSQEVQEQARWLWELLQEGSEEFRGQVLMFSTGTHRIGHAGLQHFQIQPADGGDNTLPQAMTCANMLQLPRYSCKETLKEQLGRAISLCDSFHTL